MILSFPNQQTLELALTSGIVPEHIGIAPLVAGRDELGQLWLETSEELPRAAIRELMQLGTNCMSKAPIALNQQCASWYQLVPLARHPNIPQQASNAPIMFELAQFDQLPSLVAEMLRLGNDRQSFRWFTTATGTRALLRVIGPPYYSLLRALEETAGADAPQAYYEQQPRIWVQLGYRHPFAERMTPAAGQLLLLQSPHSWTTVEEAPFRDIYEQLDFKLPARSVQWTAADAGESIQVPLTLSVATRDDAAELWVLSGDGELNPEQEVENLVRHADEQLISRLSFAIGSATNGGVEASCVVLRARPSKQGPPVLVLRGTAFKSYLRIPNLFVPVGRRLHPPLRRDAVSKLLCPDKDQVTWLRPTGEGGFVPETLPDAAFVPLSNWIDYVLDRDHRALQVWSASHRFEFESYVCAEEVRPKTAPPTRSPARPPANAAPGRDQAAQQPTSSGGKQAQSEPRPGRASAAQQTPITLHQANDAALRAQLREYEQALQGLAHDSPELQHLWQEMALCHGGLKQHHEATICWSNSLWEQSSPAEETLDLWLECERLAIPAGETSPLRVNQAIGPGHNQASRASLLVAELSRDCTRGTNGVIAGDMQGAAEFLARQEPYLPIRTAWLGWLAISRLSGGDVLSLARARDRLLERLFQHGLRPEFDMPTFLRAHGGADAHRFRMLRDHLDRLRRDVNEWIVEPALGTRPRTRAYANLIFAYGLARLGQASEAQQLVAETRDQLRGDEVHGWLRDAYCERIEQALGGAPRETPLSKDLRDWLKTLDRIERYKVDRLRNYSRILEPTERVDPYRRWHNRYADSLSRELAELFEVNDRDELESHLQNLGSQLVRQEASAHDQARFLSAALALAPRLGDAFAEEMLTRVEPMLRRGADAVEGAMLLEKGLLVAAHFGKTETVRNLAAAFESMLPEIVNLYLTLNIQHAPENKERVDAIDALFSGAFHGLRKLGLREQIGRLFGQLEKLLESCSASAASNRSRAPDLVRRHKLSLSVAGGWFYFGHQEPAEKIANSVQRVLQAGELLAIDQRTLACAYIRAIGQAPIEWALPRIEQLFSGADIADRLKNIEDNMTTSSHFSISQLDVVENLVATLASEDFLLNSESRRWLDEDEFLVRRRIHRDMQQAVRTNTAGANPR